VLRQPALAGDGGGNRILGTAERDEERVPLRVDLVAVVLGESLTEDSTMVVEGVPVDLSAQLFEQLCGALDVGEQEGDGACRQLAD
jgi:hypothetical protein